MSPASYKEQVAATFDRRGTSYNASTFHRDLAKRLLELAELRPGEHVLDVATGTGLVALPTARLVGHEGWVLGVDLSEGMLEQARHVANEEGLANLTFEQGDADTLEPGTEHFDVILCCSALIYLSDIPRALGRWHTALKPGGRLAFTCFADTAFIVPTLLRKLAAEYGVTLPNPNAPCGSLETCQELVEAAGFRPPRIYTEPLLYTWHFDSPEAAWPEAPRGPFDNALNGLGAADLRELKRQYVAEVAALLPDGELSEEVPTHFVLALK